MLLLFASVSDQQFFVRPSNGPAHLRRRASVQPVVNDAEHAQVHAMSRAAELPHTLHPFTTGCM